MNKQQMQERRRNRSKTQVWNKVTVERKDTREIKNRKGRKDIVEENTAREKIRKILIESIKSREKLSHCCLMALSTWYAAARRKIRGYP